MEIDQGKMEQFVGKAMGDMSGTVTVIMAAIGDRLGLFSQLAQSGPVTSGQLAERASLNERYVREWLGCMASSGYLAYDPAGQRFSLPPEHAPVLAQERGPVFFGGMYQMMMGTFGIFNQLTAAFRHGGGVKQSEYPESAYDGMDRFTASWHENLLLQTWIPSVPEVEAKLEAGAEVADVGCGRGRAIVKMAERFPRSRFVGFDVFAPNVARATALARESGVADRVRFEERDVSKGLPGTYDLVTTFDVVHDAADPLGLLRAIRTSLKSGGHYLCLDINCSHNLQDNAGPLGALFYGISVLYCMTTSLANGGAGLGTVGLHEHKLQELGKQAGFQSVQKLPLENPFNNLYHLV